MDEFVAAFTPNQAEHLAGVSKQRQTYWHRQGLIQPRYYDETGWLRYRRLFSFRDLVALRTIRKLRDEQGFSLQALRQFNSKLQARYDAPWSSLRFHKVGDQLQYDDPNPEDPNQPIRRWAGEPRHEAFHVDLGEEAEELRPLVIAFGTRKAEDIGQVTRNRNVMGGEWVVQGTRILTSSIWNYASAGEPMEAIVAAYPTLHPEDIEAAIRHEERLHEDRALRRRARQSA